MLTHLSEIEAKPTMLELYCDSSYNQNSDSYIGCLVLRDGKQVHQSTTRIIPEMKNNLDCEKKAIDFALSLSKIFAMTEEKITIYNDSTEAIKYFRDLNIDNTRFEFAPKEKQYQSIADRLSNKFSIDILGTSLGTSNLYKCSVESFTKDILLDIAKNNRSVFYLETVGEESTKSKTCYKLVVRSPEMILSDDRLYCVQKGGEGTHISAANNICMDLNKPEIQLSLKNVGVNIENSYFLITNETWGLCGTDSETYSILPCSVKHRIICDLVDRSAEYLFKCIKDM